MPLRTDARPQAPAPATPGAWATVARVNLLPPEILARRRFARVRHRLLAAVIASCALAAAGVVWAQSGVAGAQADLAAAQARTRQLSAQQARYALIPRILGQVDAATAARQQAMASDVLWDQFLTDVALATPTNVSLTSLTVSLDGSGSPAASGPTDVLTPTGIGTVTFAGKAASFPDLVAWLNALDRLPILDASTLHTATRQVTTGSGTTPITFTSSVVIRASALSHRYDRKAG